MLIIQRQQLASWQDDDDEYMYPDAASSMSLLQLRQETRRQTTGQVAHTQWPGSRTISLENGIDPPHMVSVDFTPAIHIADELAALAHHFGQPWPVGLEPPGVTAEALQYLQPIGELPPFGFHFFTDGSKSKDSLVGAAVVLMSESAVGFHYDFCTVPSDCTSNMGEDAAIIWALLWAIHLSNEQWHLHGLCELTGTFWPSLERVCCCTSQACSQKCHWST